MPRDESKPLDVAKLIDTYVKLRDVKAEIKAQYDAKTDKATVAMNKIEALLLAHFNATGQTSAKVNGVGTAYTSERRSWKVADRDVYMRYLEDNDAWDVLDARVNKTAADARLAAGETVAGLDCSTEIVVNVRRS